MKNELEKTVNMAFTLDKQIESWIRRQAMANDMNQSQVARKVFRDAMKAEASTKLTKAKKGKK